MISSPSSPRPAQTQPQDKPLMGLTGLPNPGPITPNPSRLRSHRRPGPVRCAPLVSALAAAARADAARFHFPGHRAGRAAPPGLAHLLGPPPFSHDLPELTQLDDLSSPIGPILRAQQLAAAHFGAHQTFFLVNGTTCGIHAAVLATCGPGKTLILPRSAHVSATSALILSGALPRYLPSPLHPLWSVPRGTPACHVASSLSAAAANGEHVAAVLITSPTYHGLCSEVGPIADMCHVSGVPLLVDEAHGGHFKFHVSFPDTALEGGADVAVQSTHKVLTSLTQSSMLHVAGRLVDRDRVRRSLQVLQSSSPSFLLLASLDAARAQLVDGVFDVAVRLADVARRRIRDEVVGVDVLGCMGMGMDPLRITVRVSELGMTGYEADDVLESEYGVLSELAGPRTVTFAINLGTGMDDVDRLVHGLRCMADERGRVSSVSGGYDEIDEMVVPCGDMVLSPRDAFFARKKKVVVGESAGLVCGETVSTYPPGIPLLVPGEVITDNALEFLRQAKMKGAAVSGAADPSLSSIVICDC